MGILKHFFSYYSGSKVDGGVENFSAVHFGWLGVTIGFIILIIHLYKKLNNNTRQNVLRLLAGSLLMFYFFRVLWASIIGRFRFDSMLPLHLCGIMIFVEFFAVYGNYKILKEFAYCAGLPGALVALITPELGGYPLFSFQYQVFILTHVFLALIPLLWITGDSYKPNKRYLPKVFGLLCSLALLDALVNRFLHSNYMFISQAPINTPIVVIEELLTYKGYFIFLLFSTLVILNLMYLPFKNNKEQERDDKEIVGSNS